MPLADAIPAAILETILSHLAGLFLAGTGGELAAARHAAGQMLAAYHPQTEDEVRLAANIIGFGLHALSALAEAAAPGAPLTRVMRLRGSAVSLSRESGKAQRRLGQLQTARRQIPVASPAIADRHPARPQPAQPQPAQATPKMETSADQLRDPGKIASAAKASGVTWTQAYEQRQRDIRIAASLKRADARIAAFASAATLDALPDRQSQNR